MEQTKKSPFAALSVIHPRVWIIFVALLVFIPLFFFIVSRFSKPNSDKKVAEVKGVNAKDAPSLLEKIGKLIQLPKDEEPTIATISNIDKLKKEPFFNGAKNGDKVLIFAKAKKALIYRESEDKIINVAPIADQTPTPSPTRIENSPTPTKQLRKPSVTPTSTQSATFFNFPPKKITPSPTGP